MEQLQRYAPAEGVQVHAYVLMTNHVHLLLTPADADATARLMKAVGQNFAQYANRRYNRVGAIWQGRYYSSPIVTEDYLLTCHRYIECNPVRAGLVAHPRDYFWSSYLANAEGMPSGLLTMHAIVAHAGRTAYKQLFGRELSAAQVDEIRASTRAGRSAGETRPRRGRPPKSG